MDMSEYKDLSEFKGKLVFCAPFLGILSLYLKDQETESVPTAATDGERLLWNRKYLETLTSEQIVALIAHEALHPALGHVYSWRRGGRDHLKWNKAGDYVINLMLSEFDSHKIKLGDGWLIDKKYANMSTEQVYSMLPDGDPDCKTCGGSGSVEEGPDGSDGSECSEPDGSDPGESGEKKMVPCPDCAGKFGLGPDIIETSGATTEEEAKRAKEWTRRLISSAQAAKQHTQHGRLPAGIERLLDDLLRPKFPWYRILSHLVSEAVRDDYDILRPDRRALQRGIYLPDIYDEKVKVVIAIDTSGSIGQEDLRIFLSETWGILKTRNVSSIRLLVCDADIHFDKEFSPFQAPPKVLPGGGGTSFVPVFEEVAKGQPPACLIYFTDTYGDFPKKKPPYPVFWVTLNKSIRELPFGQHIHFNSEV